MKLILRLFFLVAPSLSINACQTLPVDEFIWLEDSRSLETQQWVEKRQVEMTKTITGKPGFKKDVNSLMKSFTRDQPLPKIEVHGDYVYALIKSSDLTVNRWVRHPISIKYSKLSDWEVAFDLAKFSKKKNRKFIFKSAQCLEPEERYCLLRIADSSGDLLTVFEFDTKTKKILPNSFPIPQGKVRFSWVDRDHVAVAAIFSDGAKTHAGYGNQLRILKRGMSLKDSASMLKVDFDYIGISLDHFVDAGEPVTLAYREKSRLVSDAWLIVESGIKRISAPKGTEFYGLHKGFLIGRLRNRFEFQGKEFPAGDLIGIRYESLRSKNILSANDVKLVYHPKQNEFLEGRVEVSRDYIFIQTLRNVRGQLVSLKWKNGFFTPTSKGSVKGIHTNLVGAHYEKNLAFLLQEDFLLPQKLSAFNPENGKLTIVKANAPSFRSTGMTTLQRWAKSTDGTRVPYFLVGKKRTLNSGSNAVFLNGYGGYGISLLPRYNPIIGKLWLERGGFFVIANVRGGGEFGPEWHKDAVLTKKKNSIDDFLAVARDLVSTGVTKPEKIGAYSGSLGGLLVGGAMVKDPAAFGAVATKVPVFDLIRGDELISGNWKGEVGDPAINEQRLAILGYSPYHNLIATSSYPSFFSYALADDQRVHPAHARKMTAKLLNLGNAKTYYLEVQSGGHSGASSYYEQVYWQTAMIHFFQDKLKLQDHGK